MFILDYMIPIIAIIVTVTASLYAIYSVSYTHLRAHET